MALGISLLFVVFATVMTCCTLSFFAREFTATISTHQFSLVSSLASSIDSKLGIARTALMGASTQLTPAIAADPRQAQKFLDSRPTLHALFNDGIFLFGTDGSIIARSNSSGSRGPAGDRILQAFCRKTVSTGMPYVSDHYRSIRNPASPAVFLTAPLRDDGGNIYAVIGGGIALSGTSILDEVARTPVGKGGYMYLFDGDQTMLLHPDKEKILKVGALPGATLLFDRAVAGFDGSCKTASPTGEPMLSSFKHLASNDWVIAVNMPLEEAYAPLYKGRTFFILAAIAGTGAFLLLAWLMMKRLTAPLLVITRHVSEMDGKSGEDKFIPIEGGDEIGTLAKAFNGMIAALDKKQAALQESENNFRALAETASDGMLVITGNGSFVYTNFRAARTLGYSIEELLQCGIGDLAHPEDLPHLMERFHRVISWKTVPKQYETRMVHKDGTVIPVEVTSSLTIWREESADLVIFRDISERKRVHKALLDSYTLLQQTFASLNEAVFIVQTGTRVIQDCNMVVEKMFGYTREEMIGVTTSSLHISPEMSEWFGDAMLAAYQEKGYFETIFKMKRKDGTVFDSEHFVSPIRDEDGVVASHVCVVRDISERTRTEGQLKESENRFRAIFEGARDAIFLADVETGFIIDVNTQAEKLLNQPRSEIIGRHQSELHPPEFIDLSRDTFAEHIRSGGAVPFYNEVVTGAGDRIPIEVNASLIHLTNGRNVILGIFRDITERRRAEEDIRNLNSDLQERAAELLSANRELEAFGYSLSHDLKAPLTAIYCAAQALRDLHAQHLDETGLVFLEGICTASERMDELIDAMFMLSKISRMELHYEQTNLSALAMQILLRLQMESNGRKVTWAIAPDMIVAGDTPLLKSALENLLGNAWKYTRSMPEAFIEVGSCHHAGEKAFFVRDNGAGFDMSKAEKLFLPFCRLHRPDEFEGTGVGLSTVQRIIRRHGGKIWGEGAPGRGAVFYFTLPEQEREYFLFGEGDDSAVVGTPSNS